MHKTVSTPFKVLSDFFLIYYIFIVMVDATICGYLIFNTVYTDFKIHFDLTAIKSFLFISELLRQKYVIVCIE